MASIVVSGDTSGAITISAPATAGTNTLSLPANTGTAILDYSTPAYRNRIINGAMVIDQRNAGASVTPTGSQYSLDRWSLSLTVSSKFSFLQSSTAPTGFSNSLLFTSLSAYSVGAGDFFLANQWIEGFNTADLMWGTANAQTVTLSFWVRSSLTGTFGGCVTNSAQNRSYPFTFTISSANTFEYKTVTIAGDTSGTWVGGTNGRGMGVWFSLGAGSTYSGTAGAWAGANYYSATGATSVVGTNGATFYITGVQLEKGSTATSFDYRPYGTELALCQRYLPAFNGTNSVVGSGAFYSSTVGWGIIKFPVTTRVAPTGVTVSSGSALTMYANGSYVTSAISLEIAGIDGAQLRCTVSGAPTGYASVVYLGTSGQLLFTGCEL